jgi:radical SAM family uncharacterized protein/radical SAM-linked protein
MAKKLSLLNRVNRPSRYLGGELGSISKDPATVEVTMALAFPDVYEVGMSHLGFAILYHILNGEDHIAAERVYAPWPDMEEQLRSSGEALTSLETDRPLGEFDIVGFTLQYELSYTNLLNMLDLAGIPRRRCERNTSHPLIVVGGPCAFNPEPLADFIDCAVIGDAEEAVVELCNQVNAGKQSALSRAELLNNLASISGVYIPAHYQISYHADGRLAEIAPDPGAPLRVVRRYLKDLDAAPYPTRPIVPFMNTVHDRVAMEIARGCTRGCRFCQAGYIYRPVRERSPQTIADLIEAALRHSGYEEISLLSLSTGDYSCIEPLLKGLMQRHADDKVAVSFPSLRVGSLTPELMEQIKKVRKTGFTLAPEAGSERLREVINKGISADDLLAATKTAFSLGWRIIKLYFMIGLPTETEADRQGIVELSSQVKRGGRGTEGGADVNVSVSTFVPKAHTPFQWDAQIGLNETRDRQRTLRNDLAKKKLRMKYHEPELSFMEGVFARGDRRLGKVLERAVDLGCRFDGWRDHFNFELWQQAFADCGLDPAWYLRERDETEILPWEMIDCGIPKAFFLSERRKAHQGSYTADCRDGQCHGCGLCDFDSLRVRLAERHDLDLPSAPPAAAPGDDERYKIRIRLSKTGRARLVGHLEFMSVVQRAARRAELPVRFSRGFHPQPRISFPDALPTGVASLAEIIDLELYQPLDAEEVRQRLAPQFPTGFEILQSQALHWRAPSSSASIENVTYQVALTGPVPSDLSQRIEQFLNAEAIMATRDKKSRPIEVDLRPDVQALSYDAERNLLQLTLSKGSPLPLTSWLLERPESAVRELDFCKTAVQFKPTDNEDASN